MKLYLMWDGHVMADTHSAPQIPYQTSASNHMSFRQRQDKIQDPIHLPKEDVADYTMLIKMLHYLYWILK